MDSHILLQIYLIYPTEGAKEVAQSSPKTFTGIYMYLSNVIPIIILCPNTIAWGVANSHMDTAGFREVIVRPPFIGIDRCPWLRGIEYRGFQVFSRTIVFNFSLDLTTFSTNDTQNRRAIRIPGKRFRISSPTYSCMLPPFQPPESHAMSRPAKTVTLSEEERQRLARIDERGSDWRERRRARTVLLLAQGLSIDAVVAQQRIHRETVACHREAWLARSFPGLRDLPRSGAPCKLSETYKQVLGAWAKKEACTASVEDSPVRRAWRRGIGVAGAERLERKRLRLEENPAQSQKEAGRRKIQESPSRNSGIG